MLVLLTFGKDTMIRERKFRKMNFCIFTLFNIIKPIIKRTQSICNGLKPSILWHIFNENVYVNIDVYPKSTSATEWTTVETTVTSIRTGECPYEQKINKTISKAAVTQS